MTRTDFAEIALDEMRAAGCPKSVEQAAEMSIACVRAGVSPPQWARDVIFKYARLRAEQDRYGKALQ